MKHLCCWQLDPCLRSVVPIRAHVGCASCALTNATLNNITPADSRTFIIRSMLELANTFSFIPCFFLRASTVYSSILLFSILIRRQYRFHPRTAFEHNLYSRKSPAASSCCFSRSTWHLAYSFSFSSFRMMVYLWSIPKYFAISLLALRSINSFYFCTKFL